MNARTGTLLARSGSQQIDTLPVGPAIGNGHDVDPAVEFF